MTNTDLLKFCDAIMQAAQPAATYGRDTGDVSGWGILMDPDTCPPEALDWLSQFIGAPLSGIHRAEIVKQQNLVYVPNFSRTAINAAPAKWTNADTAATVFKVTEGWEAGHKTLEVETAAMASGVDNAALAQGVTKLPGHAQCILVVEDEHYSFSSLIKVSTITGTMNFYGRIKWYNINGELLSTTNVGEVFNTVGEHSINGVVIAPPGAVGAEISFLVAESKAAASKAKVWVDKCFFSPSPKAVVLPYGDGDTAGWKWLGTAGESQSRELQQQSDEEYIQSKRNFLKSLPSQERGTLQALVAAAQLYLIGNKTVFIKERDGAAYKLTVVTYESETPDSSQVKAALELQVPGGIILTYATVPGASYIIIHANYTTYKAIGLEKAFLTYNGLRNNLPGT